VNGEDRVKVARVTVDRASAGFEMLGRFETLDYGGLYE